MTERRDGRTLRRAAASDPAERPADRPPGDGTRPAFLPTEVDPTVFDEALPPPARAPAAADALAGPRRAQGRPAERQARPVGRVRRLPRLRARRRPAPARLERLRPARAAVRQALRRGGGRHGHAPDRRVGLDGGRARPPSSLFAKRAAAALGYIGLASEDRVAVSALSGRAARRRAAMRGSGRVFRLLADLSAIEAAEGPTDLRRRRPARRRPAPRPGRRDPDLRPARPGRRQGHPRARRDRLRADRPARPVARRARSAARGRPAPGRRRDRRRAST